jgi:hypothetical protein
MHTTPIGVIAGGLPSAFDGKENERANQGERVWLSLIHKMFKVLLHFLMEHHRAKEK